MAVWALIAWSAIGVVCEALLVFPAACCCNPLHVLLEDDEQLAFNKARTAATDDLINWQASSSSGQK